jgi:hypothetical protein
MTHKHQPRWTYPDRLDLLDLDDDQLHGCIVAVPGHRWEWTCQHCGVQAVEQGPDAAGAWSAFLEHERSIHLEPAACLECAEPLPRTKGKPRKWCSDACRQRNDYYAYGPAPIGSVSERYEAVAATARAALDGSPL